MDRETTVELVHYRAIAEWKPSIGDIIIRHGWLQRTKWFGVVNFIKPDGSLQVIRDGMMRLLVMTGPGEMQAKSIDLHPNTVKSSIASSYSIMQQDGATNAPVWYI